MISLPKAATAALLSWLALGSLLACTKKPDESSLAATNPLGSSSATAIAASPAACKACIANKPCAMLPECASLQGDDRANCEAVENCVQTSNCADGKGTFTDCFCGDLKMSACVDAPKSGAGAPAGACAAVIRKALGGDEPSNRDVLSRFTLVRFAGGAAIAKMNCSKAKGCATECGF